MERLIWSSEFENFPSFKERQTIVKIGRIIKRLLKNKDPIILTHLSLKEVLVLVVQCDDYERYISTTDSPYQLWAIVPSVSWRLNIFADSGWHSELAWSPRWSILQLRNRALCWVSNRWLDLTSAIAIWDWMTCDTSVTYLRTFLVHIVIILCNSIRSSLPGSYLFQGFCLPSRPDFMSWVTSKMSCYESIKLVKKPDSWNGGFHATNVFGYRLRLIAIACKG